jgi:zinc protease
MTSLFRGLLIAATTLGVLCAPPAALADPADSNLSPTREPPPVQRILQGKPGDLFAILKNGLTVLIHPQSQSDVVSLQIHVRAGSLYEGSNLGGGLSHYLEHVVSGGSTRSFTESEARSRLEQIGGVSNAYTSHNRTVYFINTTTEHWQQGLELLLSYVSESVLDSREVLREKGVIQQEIKMDANSPANDLWRLFMETAYRTHPVRIPVIGYESIFAQQEREALLHYYRQRYQPQNMVVMVAGNIAPQSVLNTIAEKTQSFLRESDQTTVWPTEVEPAGPRWEEQAVPLARLTQAVLGYPSVTLHSPDLYALDVLALVLGEGDTSRLNRRLHDQLKQVLSIGASNWTPAFVPGQFMISVTPDPQHWPHVIETIKKEIKDIQQRGISASELEKAKKILAARHVFSQETVSARATSLASSYLDTGDPYFDEQYLRRVRQVTRAQVQDVARRYLDPERLSVAVVKPPLQSGLSAVSEPSPTGMTSDSSPETALLLENGLRVLLKEDASVPLVNLHLFGVGGLYLEAGQKPGIAAFTTSLLTAGTKKRSKDRIAQTVENVGGAISSRSDNNTYHLSLKVLKEDLNTALDLLSDLVQNSQFPLDEVEKQRKDTLLAIRKSDESWRTQLVRLFKQDYFPHSSYGHERLGTSESVTSFTRQEVIDFYRRMVNPRRAVLAVFGDFDGKQLATELPRRFAGWKAPPWELPSPPNATRPLIASRSTEKANQQTTCSLLVATNGMDISDPRRPVMDVLDAVLSGGGFPGGRLYHALRGGEEDLVYLVSGFPFYGIGAGYFAVITQTAPENLERVEDLIRENFRRISREPVPEEELQRVKGLIRTQKRLARESSDAQATISAINEVLGLGWDYEKRYLDLVEAVQAEQVQELAQELFAHTLTVRTVPGGELKR